VAHLKNVEAIVGLTEETSEPLGTYVILHLYHAAVYAPDVLSR